MTADGRVLGAGPRVPVRLLGPAGGLRLLALVDTGFDGEVAVPHATARRLGLPRAGTAGVTLADGSAVTAPAARVRLSIGDGGSLGRRALLLGDEVIIGMAALRGHRLTVDAVEGGSVTIAPLSQSSPDTP